VRDRAKSLASNVGPREDSEHARHHQRAFSLDRDDAGVRMGRAHHRRVHLTGKREVVAEPPLSPEQAIVLLAPEGLANGTWSEGRAAHAGIVGSVVDPGQ